MNSGRERVLADLNPYTKLAEHRTLQSFVVCSGYFDEDPDFEELVVITEQDWLYNLMQKDGIDDPLEYLQCEYTSDDSIEWFEKAKSENKIVMLEFN